MSHDKLPGTMGNVGIGSGTSRPSDHGFFFLLVVGLVFITPSTLSLMNFLTAVGIEPEDLQDCESLVFLGLTQMSPLGSDRQAAVGGTSRPGWAGRVRFNQIKLDLTRSFGCTTPKLGAEVL